jgi:hypothetical protein
MLCIALKEEREIEIKRIDPPTIRGVEGRIVTAFAEFSIPEEELLYPVSEKWVEAEIQHKLAEEIWRYAMVCRCVNPREMMHTFQAKIQVVDNGQLNPFCRYEE